MTLVLAHRKVSLLVLFVIAAAVALLYFLLSASTADAGYWHCYFGQNLFGWYDPYCVWVP